MIAVTCSLLWLAGCLALIGGHLLGRLIRLEDAIRQKDQAYRERNRLVALVAAHYEKASIEIDEQEQDPWRHVVFIDLDEAGQVSWHVHDDELDHFAFLPEGMGTIWDRHSTEEKYRRIQLQAFATALGNADMFFVEEVGDADVDADQ